MAYMALYEKNAEVLKMMIFGNSTDKGDPHWQVSGAVIPKDDLIGWAEICLNLMIRMARVNFSTRLSWDCAFALQKESLLTRIRAFKLEQYSQNIVLES